MMPEGRAVFAPKLKYSGSQLQIPVRLPVDKAVLINKCS